MKKHIIIPVILLCATATALVINYFDFSHYNDVKVEVIGKDGIRFTAYAPKEVASRIAPGQTVAMQTSRLDTESFPDWKIQSEERVQKDTIIEELISKDLWKYTLKRNVVIDKILK